MELEVINYFYVFYHLRDGEKHGHGAMVMHTPKSFINEELFDSYILLCTGDQNIKAIIQNVIPLTKEQAQEFVRKNDDNEAIPKFGFSKN